MAVTPPMRAPTYRLTVAYDGARFAGYARQPGRRTVEGELRAALDALGVDPRAWAVGGRTDRGVSAEAQVVSVRLARPVDPAALREAVDARAGLTCLEALEVPRRFHASFSARARRYVYLWPDLEGLGAGRLRPLLAGLVGRRCFSAYARDTRHGQGTVRTLREAWVEPRHEDGAPVLAFHFLADAFLRKQVRVMVATALREARAGAPADRLAALAATGDRTRTAWPAPPEPLRLVRVVY